jgi:hypothetical protein
MSVSRWRDTLGPPLIAAAAAIVLVIPASAAPGAARGTGAGVALSSPAGHGIGTCRSGAPVGSTRALAPVRVPVGAAAALRDAAWYRLDPILDEAGSLSGQLFMAGRLGETGDVELTLAAESFAAGPVGGHVLVGTDDGARSRVESIDIAGRCARLIHEGPELIRRAILDPARPRMFEFRLDRGTRSDLGVWSRPLDGSPPTLVVAPLAPNARIGRIFTTSLSTSADGGRLIVQSCGESACLTRILDVATGILATIDDEHVGEVLGLTADRLIAYGGCLGLPCRVLARDLRTGADTELAGEAGLARLVASSAGPALVFEDYRAGGISRVVGVDGTVRRAIDQRDETVRLIPSPERALAGIELPAGWVAFADRGRPGGPQRGAAIYVRIADGIGFPAREIDR